jgi:CHAT domain-containing protein
VAVLADPVFAVDDPRVRKTPPGESGSGLRGGEVNARSWPRLLSSRGEASSIEKVGASTELTVAMGFEASRPTAERLLLDSYEVVHLATHGVLNDQHPELSGVIASLVDEQGRLQDGFLRAQDVFGMHIGAEIVVLSACETALGKMLRGEGITGLVRAFLHAGADTVVASKWKVDDVATQELMAEFYRLLLVEALPPAAALRAAQVKLFQRRSTRAPFFWGAFEVHGIS